MSRRGDDPGIRWRRLERQVALRITECGRELSGDARLVLLAAVKILAGGGEIPARHALAERLGLGRKALRQATHELARTGIVRLLDRGSRPDAWEIDVIVAERWAAGERLCGVAIDPTSGAQTAPQTVQSGHTNRPDSSIREAVPATPGGAPTREGSSGVPPEGHAILERQALRHLTDAGLKNTRATQTALGQWVRAGVPLAHIAYAANECDALDRRTLRYLERVLDRLQDEAHAAAANDRGPRLVRHEQGA